MQYDQYIQEYTNDKGEVRYAVCRWDEANGQYVRPLDAEERELTGCYAEYAKDPAYLGGYRTKQAARKRVRQLYGS